MAKPIRVLLIEDSEDDALLLLRELRHGGYDPVSRRIQTGAEMEEALAESWDIVISDYSLPQFDPLTALKILEDKALDIPCIVVSGTVGETTIIKTMKAGAADYLMKDNLMRLVPAVERELREAVGRRERLRLEEQFRQAQKMEAIGRLAGGVAHDFNNLLTVITGYTDLLLSTAAVDDSARAALDEIQRAAERGASLTRQLLIFSRKQKLNFQPVDLNALVANLEKMLRRLIGEDISLQAVLSPGLGMVHADPGQFEQVIMNMAVNARDAMPHGGSLTIETASLAWSEPRLGLPPGDYVMLAVSDTGIGMDAETRSHLFEPFFTTKGPGQGTGLGLATAYGIVRQSGGTITVYSELGQGTTFKIYFPRVGEAPEPLPEPPAPVASLAGSETILVIEDDAEVRRLICEILRVKGYDVLESAGGSEAIQRFRESSRDVALVISDVILPEMSGPEVVRQLSESKPGLRALYISGYTDEAMLRHGILEQGVMFLSKPFLPDTLARTVREILGAA